MHRLACCEVARRPQQAQDYLDSVRPQLEQVLLDRRDAEPGSFVLTKESGLRNDYEMYHATQKEIFFPVNQALKKLRTPLILEQAGAHL